MTSEEIAPIHVRAMEEHDVPAATEMRNLPGVRWGTLGVPYQSVESVLKRYQARAPEANRHVVACVDGMPVGTGALTRPASMRRAHVGGVGIMVHDDWCGRGVGKALMAALIDLADNWLNLKRLELDVYTDNARAIGLYRRFGFEVEGTKRADAFRDGAYVDSFAMARLKVG